MIALLYGRMNHRIQEKFLHCLGQYDILDKQSKGCTLYN